MKTSLLVTAAACALMTLSACSKKTDTANMADTGNGIATSAGAAIDKTQDATGAAVGATSAATLGSHDTGAFVENAGEGGMYEIQAAKIAEAKSTSPDVKAFAKMMVHDHMALDEKMKPLIMAAGKTPPTSLDHRRQGFIDNLNSAPAADFDKTYIDQQVAAHEETLSLMQGYAKDGDDAGLKGGAAEAAPKVQAHLDKAKEIQAKLAGK